MSRRCTRAQLMKKWWSLKKKSICIFRKVLILIKVHILFKVSVHLLYFCSSLQRCESAEADCLGANLDVMATPSPSQGCLHHFRPQTPSVYKQHGTPVLIGIMVREEGFLFPYSRAIFQEPKHHGICKQREFNPYNGKSVHT